MTKIKIPETVAEYDALVAAYNIKLMEYFGSYWNQGWLDSRPELEEINKALDSISEELIEELNNKEYF